MIKRVRVWSPLLRIAHWVMTIAVLVLIFTGWLNGADPLLAAVARDYHYIFGSVLTLALLLRIYLLFFGKGTDRIEDCESDLHRLHAAGAVLKFYFSLGRAPLPAWYAHNPLWGPVYLLLFLFLTLQIATGLLQESHLFVAGVGLHDLHHIGARFVMGFTALHIVAVFVHDLGGSGSDVSAMINGHRIFVIEPPNAASPPAIHRVAVDDLLKSLDKKDPD